MILEIHRHPNRKLYDKVHHEYTTFYKVHAHLLTGKFNQIEIIDTVTGEDITRVTLLKMLMMVIAETMPTDKVLDMIKTSEPPANFTPTWFSKLQYKVRIEPKWKLPSEWKNSQTA